jgi:DNA-binding MarR family transcriptional regulator
MTSSPPGAIEKGGSGRPSRRALEPFRRVDDDFEEEYPEASALATECFANLFHAADLLMELHNRQSREQYQLSPSARQVLAVIEGARQPLEPSVIAERVLITSGSMTSLLDTLERRGLVQRMPHPADRRKLLVDITPGAQAILDQLLPSLHARERDVISAALTTREQRELLRLLAKIQRAAVEARANPPVTDAQRVPTHGSHRGARAGAPSPGRRSSR